MNIDVKETYLKKRKFVELKEIYGDDLFIPKKAFDDHEWLDGIHTIIEFDNSDDEANMFQLYGLEVSEYFMTFNLTCQLIVPMHQTELVCVVTATMKLKEGKRRINFKKCAEVEQNTTIAAGQLVMREKNYPD